MNEFNTKLIEVIRKLYIYARTPLGHSDRDSLDREIALLIVDLIQMNAQEIEQNNSRPLEDLDFRVRTYNCLKRYGVNTLEQLKDMSFNELKRVRNLGNKGIKEIYQFFMREL